MQYRADLHPGPPMLCIFMLCDRVTSSGGKFSLEGVFFRIHPRMFPAKHTCYLVLGWCGAAGNYRFGLRFLSPGDGAVLLEIKDYQFNITPAVPYNNTIIRAELALPEEGVYHFNVTLDGKPVGRFPLHVIKAPVMEKQ